VSILVIPATAVGLETLLEEPVIDFYAGQPDFESASSSFSNQYISSSLSLFLES